MEGVKKMINFPAPRRFTILVLTAFVVIVFFGTSCPPQKITVAYSTVFNAILEHISFMKDFFKEEGLDAVQQQNVFGKEALHYLPFLVFQNPQPQLITP
jgi:hypothetical protein